MKQFIVLTAVFILIAVIIIQVPLEMVNYEKKNAIMFYVNNAKEKAKQEGYYTNDILDELKSNISDIMKLNDKEQIIICDGTTKTPKYRQNKYEEGEEIYIKIAIPFKNIVAASKFLNIEDNNRYFIIENVTTSEKLSD